MTAVLQVLEEDRWSTTVEQVGAGVEEEKVKEEVKSMSLLAKLRSRLLLLWESSSSSSASI